MSIVYNMKAPQMAKPVAASKSAITEIGNTLLVDHSKVKNMTAKESQTFYQKLAASKNEVIFVDNVSAFLNVKSLRDLLLAGEVEKAKLICLYFEIPFSDEEIKVVAAFKDLLEKMKTAKSARDVAYPFADVPEKFNLDKIFRFTSRDIESKRTGQSYGNGYTITKIRAEKLWNIARNHWLNGVTADNIMPNQTISGYSRTITISQAAIDIGCQKFPRHEIEQLALHFEWSFE